MKMIRGNEMKNRNDEEEKEISTQKRRSYFYLFVYFYFLNYALLNYLRLLIFKCNTKNKNAESKYAAHKLYSKLYRLTIGI